MTHSLTLGSLLLTDSMPDEVDQFVFNVIADGMSLGAPDPVREVILSLLADGDLVRTTRFGNREIQFGVEITGPDLGSVQAGEVALRRELGRGNALTWQAPDFFAAPTVFDVVDSDMSPSFNDLDELRRRRTFTVRLTCAPFARSASPVTIPALAPPVTPVSATINNADSVTGWTAQNVAVTYSDTDSSSTSNTTNYVPFDGGAFLRAEDPNLRNRATKGVYLILAASATAMSTTPYLLVEASLVTTASYVVVCRVTVDGTERTLVASMSRATTSGTTLYGFNVGPGSLTSVTFGVEYRAPAFGTTRVDVYDVSRISTLPQVTARQITRVIDVGGTERTPGSVHLQTASGTGSLGIAVVHTCPEDRSGYSPPLQRWRTVGQTRATDATAFSGTYESINVTSWVAEVPTSALPEGGYSLVARMRAQTAATVLISYSTSTIFPDSVTQQGFTLGQKSHVFAVGNEWDIVPLAVLSLPSVRTKAGKVQIALQVEAASPVVTLDEAWLFREGDDCGLSIVKTPRPHLWLNSPDLESSVPTVWVGNGDEARVHPGDGLVAQGTHVLSPEGTAVFSAALTDNPAADATFYRRWHSNAAE